MKVINILFLLLLVVLANCNQSDETIAVSRSEFLFSPEGDSATLLLQTSAKKWRIQNPADWIILNPTNGTEPTATITIKVLTKTPEPRSETLTIFADNADPVDVLVAQESSEFIYEIDANLKKLRFKKGGNTLQLEVTTDAPEWQISTDADWITLSEEIGVKGTATIDLTAIPNPADEHRTGILSLTAPLTKSVEIELFQIGQYYPDYNTDPIDPDASGMGNTAQQLADKMRMGINIGNTLEAIGGETAWGNPMINETYIKALKDLGFDAIRLPASYDQYANQGSAEIDNEWLNRIKTVVQLCMDYDFYVVLNIHWDGGWLENNVTQDKQEEVNAKQKAFWQQIATHLRDFDERLMFAGSNEPNVENATHMAVLNTYHQTFIDAVRSTGGRNSYRVLIIQGASTDIEKTEDLLNNFPTDQVEDKLMVELHYYTPYQFTIMPEDASWGNVFYYWGEEFHSTLEPERNATWGEEAEMERLFEISKSQFVDNGYPIILGEFGAYKRNGPAEQALHNASIDYFNMYVVKTGLSKGMIPFYWDTGGIINRQTGAVKDQSLLDALFEGGK